MSTPSEVAARPGADSTVRPGQDAIVRPNSDAANQPGSPARQETLRELNLALVFGVILDAANSATPSTGTPVTPPSRADIAASTGLTRATVSKLVDSLVAGGLVAELEPIASRKAGRPAKPLVPAPETIVGLGAEVSVDYLALRAVDLAGNVVAQRTVTGSYRDSNPGPVLRKLGAAIAAMHEELSGRHIKVAGVGLAVPGLVESATGLLRLAPNLGWRDVDLLRGLRAGMGPSLGQTNTASSGETSETSARDVEPPLSVVVGNEANLAALAESSKLKALPDDGAFAYVNGDVGIGAAIVYAGQAFQGSHGWSGEIGHVVIEPKGPMCRCGARGCLEQYAGLEILMSRAGLGTGGQVSELVDAAQAQDATALEALSAAGDALGIALANLTNLMDVDHVVLGGILAPLEPWLNGPISGQLAVRVLASPWASPTIGAAVVSDLPALTGAAMSALDAVRADPAGWLAEN